MADRVEIQIQCESLEDNTFSSFKEPVDTTISRINNFLVADDHSSKLKSDLLNRSVPLAEANQNIDNDELKQNDINPNSTSDLLNTQKNKN